MSESVGSQTIGLFGPRTPPKVGSKILRRNPPGDEFLSLGRVRRPRRNVLTGQDDVGQRILNLIGLAEDVQVVVPNHLGEFIGIPGFDQAIDNVRLDKMCDRGPKSDSGQAFSKEGGRKSEREVAQQPGQRFGFGFRLMP